MELEIVRLTEDRLDALIANLPLFSANRELLHRGYFSPGSIAYCLLADGDPVFAGGIVNLEWRRGEAWLLPTPFFRQHLNTCLRIMRECLPRMVQECGFVRVQATCGVGLSEKLFKHFGFEWEATLGHFGPRGETCSMYVRFFDCPVINSEWIDRVTGLEVATA